MVVLERTHVIVAHGQLGAGVNLRSGGGGQIRKKSPSVDLPTQPQGDFPQSYNLFISSYANFPSADVRYLIDVVVARVIEVVTDGAREQSEEVERFQVGSELRLPNQGVHLEWRKKRRRGEGLNVGPQLAKSERLSGGHTGNSASAIPAGNRLIASGWHGRESNQAGTLAAGQSDRK